MISIVQFANRHRIEHPGQDVMLNGNHLGGILISSDRVLDGQDIVQIHLIQVPVLFILLRVAQAQELNGHLHKRQIRVILCKPLLRFRQHFRLDVRRGDVILTDLQARIQDLCLRTVRIYFLTVHPFQAVIVQPEKIPVILLSESRHAGDNALDILLPVHAKEVLAVFDHKAPVIANLLQAVKIPVIPDQRKPVLCTDAVLRVQETLHQVLPLIVQLGALERIRAVGSNP